MVHPSSSVIPRAARSSQDDLHVGRHAILAADGKDDLPVTWPSSSGQVRALHEEEGRSIFLVDSVRATHVDSSSDRERVHTTQFDMTAKGTRVLRLATWMFSGASQTRRQFDAVSEVELADESAETDFGQTDFGHPYLTDFGQKILTDFGQP